MCWLTSFTICHGFTASLGAVITLKDGLWPAVTQHLPAMRETLVGSLGQEDPLEKGTATHSSALAWRIPRTQEPCGLPSVGSQSQTRLSYRHFHFHFSNWPPCYSPILLHRAAGGSSLKCKSQSFHLEPPSISSGLLLSSQVTFLSPDR